MRLTRLYLLPACALLLGSTGVAHAFCRVRSCDSTDATQHCRVDADGCVESGKELFWPSRCVTFDAQADGSRRWGISAESATEVLERAFARWQQADCDGETPSIEVGTYGPMECDEAGFDPTTHNANSLTFIDRDWPYPGSIDTYAYTWLHFDTSTGEILDADIEVNSAEFELSLDGAGHGTDLESILTHEAGHFLGLGHAAPELTDATMSGGWDGAGTSLRSLAADDEAGVCDIYPPGRTASASCAPLNGFASACHVPLAVAEPPRGCAVSGADPGSPQRGGALLAALGALTLLRRRSTKSHHKSSGTA